MVSQESELGPAENSYLERTLQLKKLAPRKKKQKDDDNSSEPLWKTAEKILRGPKSSKKSIVLGLFLMPASLPFIGAGQLIHDGFTTAVGALIFLGGVLLFFGGITGEIAV
jgi:hypothetical protein